MKWKFNFNKKKKMFVLFHCVMECKSMSEYPGVNWRLKECVENDNVSNSYVCLVCIENTHFCIDSFFLH